MKPFFKKSLLPSDYLIILMNLIPLAGVWLLGWDPAQMFIIYCFESIIIGMFTILKMALLPFIGPQDYWETQKKNRYLLTLGFILFFILHYGIFVTVQLVIFTSTSEISDTLNPFKVFSKSSQILDGYTRIMFIVFIGVYALQTSIEYIFKKGYKDAHIAMLMIAPYMRIFVQQFVVILGGVFLSAGAGKLFMLFFVAVKLFFEVRIDYDAYLSSLKDKFKKPFSGKQ
jgi:Family of unknown function (DUF6498)